MTYYRDDLDAARARIETLEAKLREREAALDARDAELAELRAEIARARRGGTSEGPFGPAEVSAHGAEGQRALLVALAACGFVTAAGYAMVRPSCYHPDLARPSSCPALAPAALVEADAEGGLAMGPAVDRLPIAPAVAPVDPGSFDRAAASELVGKAARLAHTCKIAGGPTGAGQAAITFHPNGAVSRAEVEAPFRGTAVGACVAQLFRTAGDLPPFDGTPVTIKKSFHVD